MATITVGTLAATSLDGLVFTRTPVAADFAAIANAIKDDYYHGTSLMPTPPATTRIFPGAFTRAGQLFIPNRGVLQVKPGDVVAVDATGWPILISAFAIASGSTEWAHT
jgi:hypothetical protein